MDWIPAIIGLITTVIAAYFSAKWATHKAFQERWWERKERAYAEIVEALHDLIRYSDLCVDNYLDPERGNTPKENEFSEKYSEAYWKIRRATDIGAFVISEEAALILEELQKRPKLDWNENPPFEIYDEDSRHYRSALAKIRKCARKDLKV